CTPRRCEQREAILTTMAAAATRTTITTETVPRRERERDTCTVSSFQRCEQAVRTSGSNCSEPNGASRRGGSSAIGLQGHKPCPNGPSGTPSSPLTSKQSYGAPVEGGQ